MSVCKSSLLVLLMIVLSSCGGGGAATVPPLSPAPTGGSTAPSAWTIVLPNSGGYGGTMTFSAGVPAASISVTSSTAPAVSSTAASKMRRPQSGTLSDFFYVTMVPKVTMTLPGVPSFNLTFPQNYPVGGKQFYYGLQVPAPNGVDQQFRTEGPGLISANKVFFGASLQPYTMTAGQAYTVVFYATTNGAVVDDLLYTNNFTVEFGQKLAAITAYPLTASGNAAAVRTIAGSQTGLTYGGPIAADADGDLVAANNDPTKSTINTFAEGANGNVAPIRSFSIPGFAEQVAVDATTGNIYVSHIGFGDNGNTDYVDTYSPTGTRLNTIRPFDFSAPYGYLITSLATDVNGNLIIGGDKTAIDNRLICAIDAFAAGTNYAPPAYVIGLNALAAPHASDCSSTAYARLVDHLFVVTGTQNGPPAIVELQNDASGNVVRSIDATPFPGAISIGVNAAGTRVFVASVFGTAIIPLVPNGSTFTVEPYIVGPAAGQPGGALVVARP